MAEKSFPLNNTDYGAEEAQLYFATRTRGVFAGTHLAVTAAGGMAVSLGTGIAWLKNGDFGGLVYANTAPLQFVIGLADATYPRIDRIVVRYDVQKNSVYAYVKQGVPASAPVPPELERSSLADEISVAQVEVAAAVTEIDAGTISDERLNEAVCGLMRDGVTGIDTSVFEAQWQELTKKLRDLLDEETAGYLQNQIDAIPKPSRKLVRKSPYSGAWTKAEGTSDEYDYRYLYINDSIIKEDSWIIATYETLKNMFEFDIQIAYQADGTIRLEMPESKFPYTGTMALGFWVVNGVPIEE